jgi:acetylornithine deacetylase/succinyl-diaminopimelate desuccinylase-like protein
MAARLKAAGFADADLHPVRRARVIREEGGLVAVLHGTRPQGCGRCLLLAHIDVVEAKRERLGRVTRSP